MTWKLLIGMTSVELFGMTCPLTLAMNDPLALVKMTVCFVTLLLDSTMDGRLGMDNDIVGLDERNAVEVDG